MRAVHHHGDQHTEHARVALQTAVARPELRRLAMESMPGLAVLLLDRSLQISSCGGAVEDCFGLAPDDLLGRALDDLLAPESYCRFAHAFSLAFECRTETFEVVVQQPDGPILEVNTAPVLADHGEVAGVIVVSRDVTSDRAATARLRYSERHFRLLVERSADVIWRLTPEGTCLWVSPSVETLLGWPVHDLPGRRLSAFLHEDDQATLRALLEAVKVSGEVMRHTHRVMRRDGHWLWVETVLRTVRYQRTGSTKEIVATSRDMTAHVTAQDALRRRNAELVQLAAGVSHELLEPLLLIRGYADQLSASAADRLTAEDRHQLGVISRNASRMQALVDAMLSHTTRDRAVVRREQISTAQLLDDVLDLLEGPASASGAIVRRGPLAPVVGDPALLSVLLRNLLANAMSRGGDNPPVIDVSCVGVPGGWSLVVADQGIGIAPKDARRIFRMFERAGETGSPGLGIGLANVRRIAELHGGSVTVESELGRGATFTVRLSAPSEVTAPVPSDGAA